MDLFFKAKITKIGCSSGIIIPKGIADVLNKDKKYLFYIKEVDNGENT